MRGGGRHHVERVAVARDTRVAGYLGPQDHAIGRIQHGDVAGPHAEDEVASLGRRDRHVGSRAKRHGEPVVLKPHATVGGVALYNEYGPTEATVWATVHPCVEDGGACVPIGRPIPGARVYVLDPDGKPCPMGFSGELLPAFFHLFMDNIRPETCQPMSPKISCYNPDASALLIQQYNS